jgi:AraC family transcriptional activator of pobA
LAALRLHHAAQAGPKTPPGSHAGLVAQFRGLVEERYRSPLGVADYAALLAVTPKRLRGACLKVAGEAPLQMVLGRRLLEAKRLMLYSNMTLTEIAYHLGFSVRPISRASSAPPQAWRRFRDGNTSNAHERDPGRDRTALA